jgi:N-carbamoylputrescine amidase
MTSMNPSSLSSSGISDIATGGDAIPGLRASPVRVAVVQFDPQVGVENLERNAKAVHERLVAAVESKAKLIVLPELATTGYCFTGREEAYAHAEPVPSGATVQGWIAFAAKHGVYIVGCLVEQDGLQLFDTAVLVGPDGYIGRYRKTHLWNNEKLWFTPGDEGYPVFETKIGRIGLLVCWDIWFPEAPRILAQLGADIICTPTNWVWTPPPLYDASGTCMAAYLTMTAAHANNVFIAAADRVGQERGSGFMGNSLIAGTNGWPVGRIAGPDEDTILYADVDLTAARSAPIWTPLNDLHRDRRTDLYDPLLGYRGGKALAR